MAVQAPWNRSTWTDAGQVLAVIDPQDAAIEARGRPLHEWFAGLMARGDLAGAVEFSGHALSRYDCICWAARAGLATGILDRTDPLVVAVLQWIDNPDDELRRRVAELAEGVKVDSPAKLLCLAVQFSGGSLAPPDLAPVLPPPDVCARLAVAAMIAGATAHADPDLCMRQVAEFGEAVVTAP